MTYDHSDKKKILKVIKRSTFGQELPSWAFLLFHGHGSCLIYLFVGSSMRCISYLQIGMDNTRLFTFTR